MAIKLWTCLHFSCKVESAYQHTKLTHAHLMEFSRSKTNWNQELFKRITVFQCEWKLWCVFPDSKKCTILINWTPLKRLWWANVAHTALFHGYELITLVFVEPFVQSVGLGAPRVLVCPSAPFCAKQTTSDGGSRWTRTTYTLPEKTPSQRHLPSWPQPFQHSSTTSFFTTKKN